MRKYNNNSTEQEFTIYFYNGFSKPEVVAESIEEFKETVDIKHHTLLLDDTGEEEGDEEKLEVLNNLEDYKNGEIYNEEIGFDILVNPTLKELQKVNKHVGLGKTDYLEEWIG